jgi:hypothetical protein
MEGERMKAITDGQGIESKILTMRGQKVILDRDLAEIYGTSTKAFNQAVKRNICRFPEDFMFRLSGAELGKLVTNCDRFKALKHSSSAPYAFTEHGAIMASMVLNSARAVEMSVQIVRAFVKMRQMLSTVKELSGKFRELEGRLDGHDKEIGAIMDAIRQLMAPPPTNSRKIGCR